MVRVKALNRREWSGLRVNPLNGREWSVSKPTPISRERGNALLLAHARTGGGSNAQALAPCHRPCPCPVIARSQLIAAMGGGLLGHKHGEVRLAEGLTACAREPWCAPKPSLAPSILLPSILLPPTALLA